MFHLRYRTIVRRRRSAAFSISLALHYIVSIVWTFFQCIVAAQFSFAMFELISIWNGKYAPKSLIFYWWNETDSYSNICLKIRCCWGWCWCWCLCAPYTMVEFYVFDNSLGLIEMRKHWVSLLRILKWIVEKMQTFQQITDNLCEALSCHNSTKSCFMRSYHISIFNKFIQMDFWYEAKK